MIIKAMMICWGFSSARHWANGFSRSILCNCGNQLPKDRCLLVYTPLVQAPSFTDSELVHVTNTNSRSNCLWPLRLDHSRHHHFQHNLLNHLLSGSQGDAKWTLKQPLGDGHVETGPPWQWPSRSNQALRLPAEALNIREHRSHHPGALSEQLVHRIPAITVLKSKFCDLLRSNSELTPKCSILV